MVHVPTPSKPGRAPGGGTAARPVILVVDDQPTNVFTLFEILKDEFEVCVATSGEAALEQCRARRPDLVLLDIGMPGMDGHEVCRRILADRTTRDIPVIFVTARDSPSEEVRALNEGAVDFISMPFHETVVRARLRIALAQKFQSELLRSFAATDGLTGLASRRRFDEAFDEEWRRAYRRREPVSLILLDVDRFKAYNDCYGHLAGDDCLRSISAVVKGFARRPGDVVARYGGEELVLLLPGADEAFAEGCAEALRAAIAALAIPHAGNERCGGIVTASIGVASMNPREDPGDPTRLIARADELLYEAKRLGRNRSLSRNTRPGDPIAPQPANEAQRIAAVEAFRSAHAHARSPYLDDIARLAATLLGTPIGLVSLVGRDDQHFVGRYGLETDGTARDLSFCAHALGGESPLIVPDAQLDRRFADNPLVTGDLAIRFYAGAPLLGASGGPSMGAVCVIDRSARPPLTPDECSELSILAKLAMAYIERFADAADGVKPAATP